MAGTDSPTISPHEQAVETGLTLLAQRFPLLLGDLQRWLATPGRNVAADTTRGAAVLYEDDCRVYVAQVGDPAKLLQRLDAMTGEQTLIHLMHSAAALLHVLSDAKYQSVLQHDRYQLLLLLPLNDARHLQQWLLDHQPRHWPWDIRQQLRSGPARQPLERFQRELHALLGQLRAEMRIRLQSGRYAQRPTPGEILRAGKRPLRLLTPANSETAYQQFCARDMRDGLRAVGATCESVIIDHSITARYELLQAIERHDPDVLILNGLTRAAFDELPEHLTVVTWDQDYVACPSPDATNGLGSRDVLAAMVEDWIDDAKSNGVEPQRVHHLNLGTNIELYTPPDNPPVPEYDVLFVGNYHPFQRYRQYIGFDDLSQGVQRLMLEARQRLDAWISSRGDNEPFVIPDCSELLVQSQRAVAPHSPIDPNQLHPLSQYFRYRIAHMLVRERYIESLSEFNLGLFGKGWDALPAVADQHAGVLANGGPQRDAIHRSAIVLHLHTWTVHHPRLYDSAAAGGFLLVGNVPERNMLDTVFDVGSEVDAFGSIAEMKRKIRWWMDHPDERLQCARAAAMRARADHSMAARMQRLLDVLATGDSGR